MASALRKLFIELDVKVNKSQLESSLEDLNGFLRTLNRLKKIGTKRLEKSLKNVDEELKDSDKSSKKLEKNLKKAGKETEDLEKGAKGAKKEFQKMDSFVAGVAAGITSAVTSFGLTGIRNFISDTMESTNQLARWSGRLQIGVRELESWVQLSSLFGADIDDVTDAFKELQLKARDALDGTKTYQDVFALIGISQEDLRQNVNSTTGMMELFTSRLTQNTDVATQNFVADELMNDAGTRMIEVFRMGNREISRRRNQLLENNEATQGMIDANSKFTESIARLGIFFTNLRNKIMIKVFPILTRLSDLILKVGGFFEEAAKNGNLLTAALIVVGVVAAKSGAMALVAWLPVIATWSIWILGIIAAILLLETLIATIKGGDTVLKDFLKDIGAWQLAVDIIDAFGKAWDYVVLKVNEFVEIWEEIFAKLARVQQFFWTITGLGSAESEIQGDSRIARARRSGARQAQNIRRTGATIAETALPGQAGTIAGAAISGIGSAQERRIARREDRNFMFLSQGRRRQGRRQQRQRDFELESTAQEHTAALFGDPSDFYGMTVPAARTDSRQISVSSPYTSTFNISGVQDPEEVGRIVDDRIRSSENERNRSVQNALVPESRR